MSPSHLSWAGGHLTVCWEERKRRDNPCRFQAHTAPSKFSGPARSHNLGPDNRSRRTARTAPDPRPLLDCILERTSCQMRIPVCVACPRASPTARAKSRIQICGVTKAQLSPAQFLFLIGPHTNANFCCRWHQESGPCWSFQSHCFFNSSLNFEPNLFFLLGPQNCPFSLLSLTKPFT